MCMRGYLELTARRRIKGPRRINSGVPMPSSGCLSSGRGWPGRCGTVRRGEELGRNLPYVYEGAKIILNKRRPLRGWENPLQRYLQTHDVDQIKYSTGTKSLDDDDDVLKSIRFGRVARGRLRATALHSVWSSDIYT